MNAQVGNSSGLAMIAGIKTLDTGMIGALIISGIVIYIHNKYLSSYAVTTIIFQMLFGFLCDKYGTVKKL